MSNINDLAGDGLVSHPPAWVWDNLIAVAERHDLMTPEGRKGFHNEADEALILFRESIVGAWAAQLGGPSSERSPRHDRRLVTDSFIEAFLFTTFTVEDSNV